jgi:hypothetical protein
MSNCQETCSGARYGQVTAIGPWLVAGARRLSHHLHRGERHHGVAVAIRIGLSSALATGHSQGVGAPSRARLGRRGPA